MTDSLLLLLLLFTQTIETSSQSLNCSAPYKYMRDGTGLCCSRCAPGHKVKTECTENQDTVCEPCGTGQYMEQWNYATNCQSCDRCKGVKGLQYAQTCSATTRAKCGCMLGRYCYMKSNKGCQECVSHKTCNRGFGVLVQGTNTSDVKCQKCLEGTFSDTVSSTDACRAHTTCDERDIIRKGNATSDTECKSAASTQTNATLTTKPETTIISTAVSRLPKTTAVKSKSLTMHSNATIPGITLISTTEFPILTKSYLPDTGPHMQLAAVIGVVAGIFLLIVVIVLLVLCRRVSQKFVLKDHTKVDANGNCETNIEMPEQQCFLQNGTIGQNHCTRNTDDHSSNESRELQSTLPLHQPESALSEPLPLLSNMDQFFPQNGSTVQTSSHPTSQPTSPQNAAPSPLVNVNINLHIGNGTCGPPAVMLKDMTPAEPKIPFGEEEESGSLLQQEDGKPSLLSVEESGTFNNALLKTLDQFV